MIKIAVRLKFAARLKEQRLLHHLKQKDLADLMHVNRSTISGYESSHKQPDFEKLIWLADYFEVSTDYLLGHDSPFNDTDDVIENRCHCCIHAIRIDDINLDSKIKLYEYKALLKKAEALAEPPADQNP